MRDVEPVQIGFIRRGPVGCSPDSLVGDDGLLEIKTKLGHLQIEVLESGAMPSDHYAQVQGQLWISGPQWCDFLDRKSTRLNSSHSCASRMPSSACKQQAYTNITLHLHN